MESPFPVVRPRIKSANNAHAILRSEPPDFPLCMWRNGDPPTGSTCHSLAPHALEPMGGPCLLSTLATPLLQLSVLLESPVRHQVGHRVVPEQTGHGCFVDTEYSARPHALRNREDRRSDDEGHLSSLPFVTHFLAKTPSIVPYPYTSAITFLRCFAARAIPSSGVHLLRPSAPS